MAAGHGLQVHFLWVTRDQKQFEWMVDLLRDVETRDTARLISTNIFITQFFVKFDIRTVMLVSNILGPWKYPKQLNNAERCQVSLNPRNVLVTFNFLKKFRGQLLKVII